MPHVTVRTRVAAAALTVITGSALLLGACSSDSDSGSATTTVTGSQNTDTPRDKASYPVTFTSPWGESTLTGKPARIAAIGYKDADVLAALGEVPVLMGDSTLKQETWTTDAFGGTVPEETFTYTDDGNVDLEKVASANPDLIVATQMDLKDRYAELSAIAPVIAAETEADVPGNWQQTIANLGEALGKQSEAADIVEQTARTAENVGKEHPEFEGRSISMLNYFSLAQTMYLSPEGSDAAGLMEEIGFTVPPGTRDLKGPISPERMDDTAADVMVVMDNSQGKIDELLGSPIFGAIPAVKEGRLLVIHNQAFDTGESAYVIGDGEQQRGNLAWALGYPGPLSTQWALETLAPLLADTVEGHGSV